MGAEGVETVLFSSSVETTGGGMHCLDCDTKYLVYGNGI